MFDECEGDTEAMAINTFQTDTTILLAFYFIFTLSMRRVPKVAKAKSSIEMQ